MKHLTIEDLDKFEKINFKLSSDELIRMQSYGEVCSPESLNFRTNIPEPNGLFCSKIFGPIKDWHCMCGKYMRKEYQGIVCEKCGVEVTQSKVRRERLGHIELVSPVAHIWFLKGVPCRVAALLDMSPIDLEKVIYFENYMVIDPGDTPLKAKELLTDDEYRMNYSKHGNKFIVGMGARTIRDLLKNIKIESLYDNLKFSIKETVSDDARKDLMTRLFVVEEFIESGNNPECIIMDVIPVLPPDLRPLSYCSNGRLTNSDLNRHYSNVINRNNRLKRLIELRAPSVIIKNEQKMLQEAVDKLFDNSSMSLSNKLALHIIDYKEMLSKPDAHKKRFNLGTYYSKIIFGRKHFTPAEVQLKEIFGENIPEEDVFPQYEDCLEESTISGMQDDIFLFATSLCIDISNNIDDIFFNVKDILAKNTNAIISARKQTELFNNHKNEVINKYSVVPIEELVPGITEYIDQDGFYLKKSTFTDIYFPTTIHFEQLSNILISDIMLGQLSIIPHIGKATEKKLKAKGYNTIYDLINHPDYAVHARHFVELLEKRDYPSLEKILLERTSSRAHPFLFMFALLRGIHHIIFLEIDTQIPFSSRLMSAGLAYFENNSLVVEQYVAKDAQNTQVICDRINKMTIGKSVFSSYGAFVFRFFKPECSHYNFELEHPITKIWGNSSWGFNIQTVGPRSFIDKSYRKEENANNYNSIDLIRSLYEYYLKTGHTGVLKPILENNENDILMTVKIFFAVFDRFITQSESID